MYGPQLIPSITSISINTPPTLIPIIKRTPQSKRRHLTVRLLVSRARSWTTELLGLASPVVSDQQGTVVGNEGLLQLVLGELIDVFLVVGDDGLGDSLADGVDLAGVATTGHANADVDFGEALEAEEEDGLVDLEELRVSF